MLKGWLLAGLVVVVGLGAPGDIYEWTYDQLALGPGVRGHLFANRTGEEVVGLELLPGGGPATVLVVGGSLVLGAGSSAGLVFLGRVVPGGVVVVALPEGAALRGAAWITGAGRVPIEIDPPIPRKEVHAVRPLLEAIQGRWTAKALPPQVFLRWPPDLDPELLQGWEGYPYLVRLDGRRSFSPLGAQIVAWRWTWEDGLVQEGPVVVRGFDSPGIYRVRLTVTDSVGRVQTLTRFVTTADWEEDWDRRPGEGGRWPDGGKGPSRDTAEAEVETMEADTDGTDGAVRDPRDPTEPPEAEPGEGAPPILGG